MRLSFLALLIALVCCVTAVGQSRPPQPPSAEQSDQTAIPLRPPERHCTAGDTDMAWAYPRMVDDYFDHYFTFHPTAATAAGFHQYDTELEDYSKKSRDAEIALL